MSKTYTTKQGDMWDSIAQNQLGSVSYTDDLMNANAKYIGMGYFTFPTGIELTLPDIEAQNLISEKLPPWKKVKAQLLQEGLMKTGLGST